MTNAARQTCPCCHGEGYVVSFPEADIAAVAAALREACRAAGKRITGDDRVDEATAAMLIGRAPKTMSNWRSIDRPIPFIAMRRAISYRVTDLARWLSTEGTMAE